MPWGRDRRGTGITGEAEESGLTLFLVICEGAAVRETGKTCIYVVSFAQWQLFLIQPLLTTHPLPQTVKIM